MIEKRESGTPTQDKTSDAADIEHYARAAEARERHTKAFGALDLAELLHDEAETLAVAILVAVKSGNKESVGARIIAAYKDRIESVVEWSVGK